MNYPPWGLIPQKLHRYCGILDHFFSVFYGDPYQDTSINPGWVCAVWRDESWHQLCLPFDEFPHEVEALAILSRLNGEEEREGRYIQVHAAYEAVVPVRDLECSSIRHLLAHPVTRLTRQSVRSSLLRRFGKKGLDLRDYFHRKEFYRCMGIMLIAIDDAIDATISSRWGHVLREARKPSVHASSGEDGEAGEFP